MLKTITHHPLAKAGSSNTHEDAFDKAVIELLAIARGGLGTQLLQAVDLVLATHSTSPYGSPTLTFESRDSSNADSR